MGRNSLLGGLVDRAGKAIKGSVDDIGWLQNAPDMPPVEDGTRRFDNLLFNIKNYQEHSLPKSFVYLLVPGLFSNLGAPIFDETITYFLKLGLDCEVAKIDTQAGVLANASKIKELIEKLYYRSRKRVVILGHSKGGVDSAAALSIYWNQLRDKVVGLVLAQSPYAGNPVASDVLRQGLLKHVNFRKEVMEIVMSGILNGDLRAIEDLTYVKRREFLSSYPLPREIPVVSFHTETCNMDLLKLRYREKSDGIVTRKDAEAPGSVVVRLQRKLSHAWIIRPCLNDDQREANNSQVIEALFTLLMEVADRKGFLLLAN